MWIQEFLFVLFDVCLFCLLFCLFSCSRMSSLPVKPGLRLSVAEWSSNNHQLSAAAQHEQHVSSVTRQEARSLRNETSCQVTSCSCWEPVFWNYLVSENKHVSQQRWSMCVIKSCFRCRRRGMRATRPGSWASVSGTCPGGGMCWTAALRRWMKRWRLWLGWRSDLWAPRAKLKISLLSLFSYLLQSCH